MTEFLIRGTELSSSVPGHYATEFEPDEEDYLRWLAAIGEMGANTVKVSNIMDDDFYNAFYDYNQTSETPLYLLQEIPVSDAVNYGEEAASIQDVTGGMADDGKILVDIIHGRKSLMAGEISGGGHYRRDISNGFWDLFWGTPGIRTLWPIQITDGKKAIMERIFIRRRKRLPLKR